VVDGVRPAADPTVLTGDPGSTRTPVAFRAGWYATNQMPAARPPTVPSRRRTHRATGQRRRAYRQLDRVTRRRWGRPKMPGPTINRRTARSAARRSPPASRSPSRR
jgi:hypothetical protein